MRGERVSEHMGTHLPRQADLSCVALQDLPEAHARESGSPARVDEEFRRAPLSEKRRPPDRRCTWSPTRRPNRRTGRCAASALCLSPSNSLRRDADPTARRLMSSETRNPVAYSNSIMARSRRPPAVVGSGAASRRSTSSIARNFGSTATRAATRDRLPGWWPRAGAATGTDKSRERTRPVARPTAATGLRS